jgi:hypothetical protein
MGEMARDGVTSSASTGWSKSTTRQARTCAHRIISALLATESASPTSIGSAEPEEIEQRNPHDEWREDSNADMG